MRIEVVRTTVVLAAMMVLLAGFAGGYATTALLSDREGIDVAVAAAGPAPEPQAGRYHVFSAATLGDDDVRVDHAGEDVAVVSVVSAGNGTVEVTVSRVVGDHATVRISLDVLAEAGVDTSSFTVLVDGRTATHGLTEIAGETWVTVPLSSFSTHTLSVQTVERTEAAPAPEPEDSVNETEPAPGAEKGPNDERTLATDEAEEPVNETDPAPEQDQPADETDPAPEPEQPADGTDSAEGSDDGESQPVVA